MRKVWSFVRWFLVMLISLFGWITAKFMFPIAYVLRDIPIVRNKILWFYYDDEDGLYGTDWWRNSQPYTFWTAYKWSALRNPAWNLQASLKPKEGLKKHISSKGSHSKDGNYDISIFDMCVLKWVNKVGEYMDNKGEYLSHKHSIFGSMFVWYKIDEKLYFRYSFANKIFRTLWMEIMIGTNDFRYLFRFKIKNVKIL